MRHPKSILIVLISLLYCQQAYAGFGPENPYPVTAIKENLKKGANAVVRSENTTYRIINTGKAVQSYERVVTILNAQGSDEAILYVPYSKLSKVKKIAGILYSAEGKQIRKLKSSEISDNSYYSYASFFDDNRYKAASLKHSVYPYTVIWQVEEELNNMLFYPVWRPLSQEKISVEKSDFSFICPANISMRHRTMQLEGPETIQLADGATQYHWQVKDLQVMNPEPLSVSSSEWLPQVITAPNEFQLENYRGSAESWQQLGRFIYQLNQGRGTLSQEAKASILAMTQPYDSQTEKIKAIYEYMQQNTRYVSIQLGIGGWQPFEASFVQQKGYGDCKALTNYTHSLLDAVGIKSYYTLIRAGEDNTRGVMEDFPKSYFNHAILCVPQEQDTIWLECTSQTNPFGHLGSFTGNRKALLITEEGGKLVNTRHYGTANNFRNSQTIIDLKQEQPLYTLSRRYGGIQFDEPYARMSADPQRQKKWLYEAAGLPGVTLTHHQFKVETGAEPLVELNANGILTEKLSRAGNRMFVPMGLGKFPLDAARPAPDRKTDFVHDWGYTYTDTLVYKIPNHYIPEHLPDPQHIKTAFGEYKLEAVFEDGQLKSIARLSLYAGRYPADQYTDWVAFVQQIRSAYVAKAVLIAVP